MSRFHSIEVSFVCAWLAGCIVGPEGEAPKADATVAAEDLLRRDQSPPPADALADATHAADPDDLRTLDAGAATADSASPDALPGADAGPGTDAGAGSDAIVVAPRPPPADLCVAFDAVAAIEMEAVGSEWHGAVEIALVPGRYHVDVPQPVDYDGLARFVAPETGHYYISFEGLRPSSQPRLYYEALPDCQPAAGTGEGFDWPALTPWAGPVTQVTLAGGETLLLALRGATGPMDVVLRVDSAPALPDDADCEFAPDLCPVGSYCGGDRCTPIEPAEEVAAALVRWSPAPPGWPEEDTVALHLTWRGASTLYYQIEGATPNGPTRWRAANLVEAAWQEGDLHHGMARIYLWGEDPAALTWRLRVLFTPAGAGPWHEVAPVGAPDLGPEGAPCGGGWPACADGLDCRDDDGQGARCGLPDPTCMAPSRPVFVPHVEMLNDDRHEAITAVLDGDAGRCPTLGAPAGAVFTAPQAGRWTFRAVEVEQRRSLLCLSRGCACNVEVCSGPGGAVTATLAAGESIAVFAMDVLGNPGVGLLVEARPAAPPFSEVHLVPNEVAGVALQLVTNAPDDLRAVRIEWLDDLGETRLVEVQPLDNGTTPFGSAFWFTPQTREAPRFPGARVEVATRDGLAVAPVVVVLEDAHKPPGAPCLWGPVDLDCPAPEACVGPDDVARCVALEAEEWPAASLLVEVLGTSAWITHPEQPRDGPDWTPIWAQVRVKDAQGRVLGAAPGWRTTDLGGENEIWLGELSIAERRAIANAELRLVAHDRVQAAVALPVVQVEPGQAGEPCAYPAFGIYPGCAPGFSCGWGDRCEPTGALIIDDARLTRTVLDGGAPGLLLSVRGQGASGPPFLQGHMLLAEGFRPLGFSTGFAVDVDEAGNFEGTAELFIDVPPEWVVGYRAELFDGIAEATVDVPL